MGCGNWHWEMGDGGIWRAFVIDWKNNMEVWRCGWDVKEKYMIHELPHPRGMAGCKMLSVGCGIEIWQGVEMNSTYAWKRLMWDA